MSGHHTNQQCLDPYQEMAKKAKRNCTGDSEFGRDKKEYANYLFRDGYKSGSIDNTFQNVQLLSQETRENQVKVANNPSNQKCIISLTPKYHPVISEMHKIIRINLRSAAD